MSVIKTNQFMLYRAKVAVWSKKNTKHKYTVWAERTVLNVQPVGASSNQQALTF
jgi:hypothetical protein